MIKIQTAPWLCTTVLCGLDWTGVWKVPRTFWIRIMGLVKTQLMGCGCGQPASGPVWDAESILTMPEAFSAVLWQQPHVQGREKLN